MEQLAVHHHRHHFTSIQSPPHDRARNATAVLPSGEVAGPRPKDACVLVDGQGLVWARNGGADRQPNRLTAHARPALDPHRRALPRFSSSLLVSPRLSHECPRLLPSAHCPLPRPPRPFPTAVASWARPGLASLMLRESPQPVTAKGCPR